jgi:hypothetical protein
MYSRVDERNSVAPNIPYWLIIKHDGLHMSVLTIELTGGQKVLPVFGHAEEAETFLRALEDSGWQIRETAAGELVSVLFGLYANIRKVALDPPAPGAGAEVLARLVSLGREDFVDLLTSGAEARSL